MPTKPQLNPAQHAVLAAIRFYQAVWSPDHSPRKERYPYGYCKYYPTCSQYGYEAVERFGVIKGSLLAAWRVLRCNPWSKGGSDPLP
jgi:putative membrane protein insertion efficiency factor